ncbi:MAG: class A beta-lactamase-related serine hydrolase [Gemmatimonadota bacterium]|nr:class A beta-lactamase-related serine hydrolase [Gemmatimonadota bacterium]
METTASWGGVHRAIETAGATIPLGRFLSASLVKAMLLVAYLDRPEVASRPLDAGGYRLLALMIRRSDNDAATAVHDVVGNRGLVRVAHAAGMRDFAPAPSWGSSGVTAADQARFFFRLDRLVPERHRDYARQLLAKVVPSQRWGIPQAAPPGWSVFFKGGWRPTAGWTVNQAALLERAPRRLAVSVLTDRGGSYAYGTETVRGVARRLLRDYR